MSKNNPQELIDAGFSPEQFGKDATVWAAFAQPLLDEANQIVQERTGTQYTSADANIINHIKRAERFLAAADLCQRRINRIDASSSVSRDDISVAQLLAEIRNSKKQYEADAERELAGIPAATSTSAATSSAPAFGSENSSHFSGSGYTRNSLAGIGGVQ